MRRSGQRSCGSVRARQGFVRFAHRCAALTRPPRSRDVLRLPERRSFEVRAYQSRRSGTVAETGRSESRRGGLPSAGAVGATSQEAETTRASYQMIFAACSPVHYAVTAANSSVRSVVCRERESGHGLRREFVKQLVKWPSQRG